MILRQTNYGYNATTMAFNVSQLIDKTEEGANLHSSAKTGTKPLSLRPGQLQSFQFAKWRIGLKHTTLMVLEMY